MVTCTTSCSGGTGGRGSTKSGGAKASGGQGEEAEVRAEKGQAKQRWVEVLTFEAKWQATALVPLSASLGLDQKQKCILSAFISMGIILSGI